MFIIYSFFCFLCNLAKPALTFLRLRSSRQSLKKRQMAETGIVSFIS